MHVEKWAKWRPIVSFIVPNCPCRLHTTAEVTRVWWLEKYQLNTKCHGCWACAPKFGNCIKGRPCNVKTINTEDQSFWQLSWLRATLKSFTGTPEESCQSCWEWLYTAKYIWYTSPCSLLSYPWLVGLKRIQSSTNSSPNRVIETNSGIPRIPSDIQVCVEISLDCWLWLKQKHAIY